MADAEAVAKPVEAVPAAEEKPADTTEAPAAASETAEPKSEVQESEIKEKPKPESQEPEEKDSETKMLKTTAQIDRDNYSNNRKFDPSTREVTDDPAAIRKQVEFYFGDWNFPQDKFMWESCNGPENKPMPIATIHSFKRMRTFQPYSAVVAALRDSQILEIQGEEGKETVKRKIAYKPMAAAKAKSEASTVYVKGFGDESPDSQFELEKFFAEFGEVKGLKLRRTNENLFKGSVFVTFGDEAEAKKFLELDPAPTWQGHELKVMTKHDYCEEKNDLIRQGKLEPNQTMPRKFYEGKDNGGKRGDKPHNDDWKKRRDYDQKNGFRDRRGGGRGRGGRGRGGGRGGRDGFRGDRPNDRNRERDDRDRRHNGNDAKPFIKTSGDSEEKGATNGKRARDEDGAAEAPAAKKVDVKDE